MTKSKCSDGRRHNRPPEAHQIRPGEVRNPFGRKGKSRAADITRLDELYSEEGQRIVSQDENGPVTAFKRLVQEEYHSALMEKDPQARARILKAHASIEARKKAEFREFADWYYSCQERYRHEFALAKLQRKPPPDVAHPDHVHLRGEEVFFTGPIDRESRKHWEQLKGVIKFYAWKHQKVRTAYRHHPTEKNLIELRSVEKMRRALMRRVPKGWNWREEIYCRYSMTEVVNEAMGIFEDRP